MSKKEQLDKFVKDALTAGRTRPEIKKALAQAGWSEFETNNALDSYADIDFLPPVPKQTVQTTARDYFIYGILLTALFFTAYYLIEFIHSYIDLWFATELHNYNEKRYLRKRNWSIAILVITIPVYLWLSIKTHKETHSIVTSTLRIKQSLIYIILYISAFVFLADMSYILYTYLNGTLNNIFLYKALTIAIVNASVFLYYLREIRNITPENKP